MTINKEIGIKNKSKNTAITRRRPSKPMQKLSKILLENAGSTLDYGCGKGFDAEYFNMDRYDPNFYPTFPIKKYNLIVCNYVLNVIEDIKEREEVIQNILSLLSEEGVAYITVRRDIKKEGYTSKGTFQQLIYLPFDIIFLNSSFCTYILKRSHF